MPSDSFAYCEDDVCDVVCTAEINEFMGSRTAQVFIKAMAPSESVMKELTAEEKKYERLIGGTPEPGDEKEIPDLNSFRAVFKFLRRETGHEGRKMSYYYARTGMSENFGADVSYCKLRLILDILSEQKLIDYKNFGGTAFWAKLNPTDTKTNIDDSELLKRLRSGSGEKNA